MPYEVVLSKRAQEQLAAIEDYLAERFFPRNAARFAQRLLRACRSLALAPHRGTALDEVREGMRFVGFEGRATIYFKVVGETVFVIGIFYGGKVPYDLFEDDEVEPQDKL